MIFDHVPDFLALYETLAEETLTVSTNSLPLAAVPAATVGEVIAAIITVEVTSSVVGVNLTMITDAAVVNTDHFIPAGGLRVITGSEDINQFEMIRNGTADAIVGILYIGKKTVVTS